MRVEVLYFDGCPTSAAATRTLKEVLAELGEEADVELVAVNSQQEAKRLGFPGSPTLRVDGRDLFPVPDRSVRALGCRTYATAEGLKGYPTGEMVRDALDC